MMYREITALKYRSSSGLLYRFKNWIDVSRYRMRYSAMNRSSSAGSNGSETTRLSVRYTISGVNSTGDMMPVSRGAESKNFEITDPRVMVGRLNRNWLPPCGR